MIASAHRLVRDPDPEPERRFIVICKQGPAMTMDQGFLLDGAPVQVETVATLAEALALCSERRVDRLVVNMFTFSDSELTALAFFRGMRPDQHVVAFCTKEVASMLEIAGLADECYPIGSPERSSRSPRLFLA